MVLFIVISVTGCGFQTKEQKAYNACVSAITEIRGVETLALSEVTSFLDGSAEDAWPLKCQQWSILFENSQIDLEIERLKDQKSENEARLDQIDKLINQQSKDAEAVAQTATAQAMPTKTETPLPGFLPTFTPLPPATP